MAQDDGQLIMAAILGFGGGLYAFAKGFREFRKSRVVADTPEIRIRSVPMGFVQIRGEARGEQTLLSPVTRTPCHLFKLDIEEWHSESEGGGEWKRVATDLQCVKFDLQDASGNVLVDPTNAELYLPPSPVREIRGHGSAGSQASPPAAAMPAGTPATDGELLHYIEQARVRHLGQMVGKGISLIARAASPTQQVPQQPSLLSMLTNPTGFGAADFKSQMIKMMVARKDPTGQNTRLALEIWKYPQGSPEYQAVVVTFGQAYTRTMNPSMPTPNAATVLMYVRQHPELVGMVAMLAASADPQADPELEKARQAALAFQRNNPTGAARGRTLQATGHFRLTEYCLRPGQVYDISGTCAENPQPRDEFDRNIILKGTNEPTFLISSKGERKAVASGLRKKAAWMILGGAAVAVVCLAILLGKMGLL